MSIILLSFLKRFWPYLATILAVIGVIVTATVAVHRHDAAIRTVAYASGRDDEVRRQNAVAVKLTQTVTPKLAAIDASATKAVAAITTKESPHVKNIVADLAKSPPDTNCVIDADVMREANAIRASLPPTAASTGGSNAGG